MMYRTLAVAVSAVLGTSTLLVGAEVELFQPTADSHGVFHVSTAALDTLRSAKGSTVVSNVRLPDGAVVDVSLERFAVTGPKTRFVLGDGTPIDFDDDAITLLRGSVDGHAGSHVFLGFGPGMITGRVELGLGSGSFAIGPVGDDATRARIAPMQASSGLLPGVPFCGADASGIAGTPVGIPGDSVPSALQHIEMALDTDYEYYVLFNDVDAAFTYAVMLYGAISDIFQRDANAYITIPFVRVFDDPNDLFNQPDPLGEFRSYWEDNMGDVERDVAQFLSGRRDLPYGGIAWVSAICSGFAYSVVGYVIGEFPDPAGPNFNHYDIVVAAHELGHNAGSFHTHDYNIDSCNNLDAPPQRGTIMSYCSQTNSGGNANIDIRFHSVVQQELESFITSIVGCTPIDCNQNGFADSFDIGLGTSEDDNGDGIPDECQDCNSNGQLDPDDILLGVSDDVNGNTLPDECEADCNENAVPDTMDVANGTSDDTNGNLIPDECEPDCNNDGQMDYAEIQADMSLDVNRDTVLDGCEDCNDDGTPDAVELGGAHDVWLASHDAPGLLRRLHATSGVVAALSETGQVNAAHDVVITPGGRIFVSSGVDDRVAEFDGSGAFVGDFVSAGAGGLDAPGMMAIGSNGNLFVVSQVNGAVYEYDGNTGAIVGAFVQPGDTSSPFGLAFGPDGNLYVSSENEIHRFNGATGAFIDVFVDAADNGGLDTPRGMLFKPDGNLLVASFNTNQVLEYDGATGDFVGQFNQNGTETALTLDGPWGVRLGRDGDVFVSRYHIEPPNEHDHPNADTNDVDHLHINSTRIYVFSVVNGYFLRSYSLGHDTEIWTPTGFDFYPGDGVDCNVNHLPDACDIASGNSLDVNGNGVPDECEGDICVGDLDDDGTVGINDLLLLLAGWGMPDGDVTGDGNTDVQDLLVVLGAWGDC